MQRKIKFRIFNKYDDNFKMLTVNSLSWCMHKDDVVRAHFKGGVKFGGTENVCSGFGKEDFSEDYGWMLMQYIGTVDRNEKEIYEGDIVDVCRYETEEIYRVKIEDMEEDFINRVEKMAIKDGESMTFEQLVNIKKNIEQNRKVLKIAEETYIQIFEEI